MKVRSCGALMGALLTISSVEAATTASKPPPHPIARPDPAKKSQLPAAKNAGPFYDYNAAGPVSEHFIRTDVPVAGDYGWRTAPNDARIRFFRHPVYAPATAYPYPPAAHHPPHPAYYYYPAPRPGVPLEQQGFSGGVGYGGMNGPGGGGGYGGQAYLYRGRGSGSDEPSNGGGVNLPPGYGPTYRGVWQGPVNPTRGGFSVH